MYYILYICIFIINNLLYSSAILDEMHDQVNDSKYT